MGNSYRLDQIYASLVKNGSVNVNELAEIFQVTPTTIRRDLLDLEERGLINRTRGAAYITGFSNQADILRDEKNRIAEKALSYIGNRYSLVFDSGSTVEAIADKIINSDTINSLDIVTHSLPIALKVSPYFRTSMPGGAVLMDNPVLVGDDVEQFYSRVNVDVAFVSSTGVMNCGGLTSSYPLQIQVKRKLISSANKKIAVLDSTKFMHGGVHEFCSFNDIDVIITTKSAENAEQIENIKNNYDVQVVFA